MHISFRSQVGLRYVLFHLIKNNLNMKQFKSQRDILIISFIFTLANFLLFKWYADLPLYATLTKCLITFILNYLFWATLAIHAYVLKFFLILLSTTSIILVYSCYIYDISPLVNSVVTVTSAHR